MKENLIAGIVGIVFVCAIAIPLLIFTGCFEGEELPPTPIVTPTHKPTPIPTPTISAPTPTPTPKKYQDSEYIAWSLETSVEGLYYAEKRLDALIDDDWISLKIYAGAEYDFLSDALDEIDTFEVTPGTPLSKSKKERKAALQDGKWSAYYLEKAADSYLSGDIQGSIDYMEMCSPYTKSAIEHLKKVTEILE